MSEISKQALKVDNSTSFPNNNTGYISPAILRAFNVNMIDSLVDEIGYTADSASWNVSIGQLNTYTSSFAPSLTQLNAFTASQLVVNSNLNAFTQSAGASITRLDIFSSSFNAYTASINQIRSNGVTLGNSTIFNFVGPGTFFSASLVQNIQGNIATLTFSSDGAKLNTSSFNDYTASAEASIAVLNQFTASQNVINTSQSVTNQNTSDRIDALSNKTGSYATTASNQFNGDQSITGSLYTTTISTIRTGTTPTTINVGTGTNLYFLYGDINNSAEPNIFNIQPGWIMSGSGIVDGTVTNAYGDNDGFNVIITSGNVVSQSLYTGRGTYYPRLIISGGVYGDSGFTSPGGFNVQNFDNTPVQFGFVNVNVDTGNNPSNVFSGLQVNGTTQESTFKAIVSSYNNQHPGEPVPTIYAGGVYNGPFGNSDTTITFYSSSINTWMPLNVRAGAVIENSATVTGSFNLSGSLQLRGDINQITGSITAFGNVKTTNGVFTSSINGGLYIDNIGYVGSGSAGAFFIGTTTQDLKIQNWYSSSVDGKNIVIENYSPTGSTPIFGKVALRARGVGGAVTIENTSQFRVECKTEVTGAVYGNIIPLTITNNTASMNLTGSNFFTLALVSGSATRLEATNVKGGQTINLLVTQPNIGSGSLTYGSQFKFAPGNQYTASANSGSQDILTFITFDSSSIFTSAIKGLI